VGVGSLRDSCIARVARLKGPRAAAEQGAVPRHRQRALPGPGAVNVHPGPLIYVLPQAAEDGPAKREGEQQDGEQRYADARPRNADARHERQSERGQQPGPGRQHSRAGPGRHQNARHQGAERPQPQRAHYCAR
jgi:hypothetical protein